jgi:hypothetical protein
MTSFDDHRIIVKARSHQKIEVHWPLSLMDNKACLLY